MHRSWKILLCVFAPLWACVCAAPVDVSPVSVSIDFLETDIAKRETAGPQAGGANFPDPSIIQVDGVWYSFATRTIGSQIKIQVARSNDFNVWGLVYNQDGSQHDALPRLPSWVNQQSWNTWGPDVVRVADGTFVMYFSATTAANSRFHCVGVATSQTITGPYTPQDSPLYCPTGQGGAIDASGYEADGKRYVLYKVDGNALGNGGPCGNTVAPLKSTPIILQPVGADGFTPQGGAVTLLNHNGKSDDGVIEAPSLVRSGGTWVLFFSSGCFTTPRYTVSYATAKSVTGPYTRAAQPLLKDGDQGLKAPGGMAIWRDGNHMLFHGNSGSGRALYTARVAISGGKVTV